MAGKFRNYFSLLVASACCENAANALLDCTAGSTLTNSSEKSLPNNSEKNLSNNFVIRIAPKRAAILIVVEIAWTHQNSYFQRNFASTKI